MNETASLPGTSTEARPPARILVVEDERTVRLGCVFALREQGWDVVGESSAMNALGIAPERDFDLVVLDYMMPGLDGLGLMRALGAPGHRPQVLLMSAWADGAVAAEALRAGVVDFLEKPLSPDELRKRVRTMLERRRHRVESGASSGSEGGSVEAAHQHALILAEAANWPGVRDFIDALGAEQQSDSLALIAGIACDIRGEREEAARWFRTARFPANWRFGGPEIFSELARRL